MYLAADKNNEVFAYEMRPKKYTLNGYWDVNCLKTQFDIRLLKDKGIDIPKWEDEHPVVIERIEKKDRNNSCNFSIVQIEYALSVDKHRHFATAAEECSVTQPTLSMQLKKMEEALGVNIFDRSKQPVIPTEIGVKLLEKGKEIVEIYKEMKLIVDKRDQNIVELIQKISDESGIY